MAIKRNGNYLKPNFSSQRDGSNEVIRSIADNLRSRIGERNVKSPLRTMKMNTFDENTEISIKCKIPIGNKEFQKKSRESFVKNKLKKEENIKSKSRVQVNFSSRPVKQLARPSSRPRIGPKISLGTSQSSNRVGQLTRYQSKDSITASIQNKKFY